MIELKINTKEFFETFDRNNKVVVNNIVSGMKRGMDRFDRFFTTFRLSGRRGNVGLNRQSGTLADNFFVIPQGTGLNTIFIYGTRIKYARPHEFGATIVPKKKKILSWVKDGKRFFAKKVVLKPRLTLFDTWGKVGERFVRKSMIEKLQGK